jgi:hypothetical protein
MLGTGKYWTEKSRSRPAILADEAHQGNTTWFVSGPGNLLVSSTASIAAVLLMVGTMRLSQ